MKTGVKVMEGALKRKFEVCGNWGILPLRPLPPPADSSQSSLCKSASLTWCCNQLLVMVLQLMTIQALMYRNLLIEEC